MLLKNVQRDKEIEDQFITTLKQQSVHCDFIKQDELIRDQVIERSKSHRIRVKLLERGTDMALVQIRTIASTGKLTELHANHMDSESAPSVN